MIVPLLKELQEHCSPAFPLEMITELSDISQITTLTGWLTYLLTGSHCLTYCDVMFHRQTVHNWTTTTDRDDKWCVIIVLTCWHSTDTVSSSYIPVHTFIHIFNYRWALLSLVWAVSINQSITRLLRHQLSVVNVLWI